MLKRAFLGTVTNGIMLNDNWQRWFVESTAREIIDLLGIRKAFRGRNASDLDLLARLKAGLPYSAVESMRQRLRLGKDELLALIDMNSRTLSRRKLEKRLRPDESDRLSRLARVASLAIEVLGGEDNANRWLRHPNFALGGMPPLSYLNTDLGTRRVEAVLSHIDHGDIS